MSYAPVRVLDVDWRRTTPAQRRRLVSEAMNAAGRAAALMLDLLNPMLRGWSAYYRHAWGAKRIFATLDSHVWWTIRRWLWAKHEKVNMRRLYARYGWRKPGGRTWRWRDGDTVLFEMVFQRVERYRHAWMKTPDFASTSRESPVHNERCTPGSAGGARKPTRG